MKKFQLMGVSLFALGTLAVAACSDQAPITGVPSDLRVRTAVIPSGGTVCSQAGNGWFAINQNTSWANPPAGGAIWVGQSAVADINYTKSTLTRYNSTFEVPAGATNIAILGRVLADNEVVIAANAGPTNAALVLGRFYSSFPENDPSLHFFPPNAPDGTSYVNFQTALGNVFGTNSGFTPGNNTVSFLVYNDDNPDTGPTPLVNPSGLAFCYVVTYTPQEVQPLIPMFVIGDVEAHAVGNNANFWGAQWWKNNFMSGVVSNGVASFKGYATQAGTCGGTWVSLPGNSSNPPATIPAQIAVIVTSKVLKQGNNISGDIKQIVIVNQDGNYQDNPGHAGNGPIVSIQCTAP